MLLSERSESNQRIAGDGQDKISAQSASSYIVLSPDPITGDALLFVPALSRFAYVRRPASLRFGTQTEAFYASWFVFLTPLHPAGT